MQNPISINRKIRYDKKMKEKGCTICRIFSAYNKFIRDKKIAKGKNFIMGKRFTNGSFTIEAAFIGPLMMFLIVLVMYIGFYLHNQAVTENYCTYVAQMLSQSAFKYMNLPEKTIDTEKEFEVTWHDNWERELQMHIEKLTNDAKKDLNRALIAGEIENFEISYQYHMLKEEVVCEVLAKGTTMFPFNLFGKNQLKYDVKSQGRAYDEIKLLWKMNLLKGDDSSD